MIAHFLTTVIGLFALPFVGFTRTSTEIFYVLLLGVFQLGIPYVLYTMASKHCSPLTCSLIATLEPLLNPVWVFLFIGELPGFYALIGAVIVILSISVWLIAQGRKEINSQPILWILSPMHIKNRIQFSCLLLLTIKHYPFLNSPLTKSISSIFMAFNNSQYAQTATNTAIPR